MPTYAKIRLYRIDRHIYRCLMLCFLAGFQTVMAQPLPTVAVMPLERLGDFSMEPDVARDVLGDLLTKTGLYSVISAKKVDAILEINTPLPPMPDAEVIADLGEQLAVDFVLYGIASYADNNFLAIMNLLNVRKKVIVNSITAPFEGNEADWIRISLPEVISQMTGVSVATIAAATSGYIAIMRSRVYESIDKLKINLNGARLRSLPDRTDCLIITDIPAGIHMLDLVYYTFQVTSEVKSYGVTVREGEVSSLKVDIQRGSDAMRLRAIYPGMTLEEWKDRMRDEYEEFHILELSLEEMQ